MSWNYQGQHVTFHQFHAYRTIVTSLQGLSEDDFDALPVHFRLPTGETFSLEKTVGELIEEHEQNDPFAIVDPHTELSHLVVDVQRPPHGAFLLFVLAPAAG